MAIDFKLFSIKITLLILFKKCESKEFKSGMSISLEDDLSSYYVTMVSFGQPLIHSTQTIRK